ncbi:MAG: hypothetical protein M1269_02780 [Chloroflexi bacterium]|nr:hypothetical protein [Chloroflexota bacterium]
MSGYWRPLSLDGSVWVDGAFDDEDRFIPGHWQPVASGPADMVWDPGYWYDGFWVDGHWRQASRDGWEWIPSHWNSEGVFITGHWRPVGPSPDGMVWEPGHWNHDGFWIEGHWRAVENAGMIWIPGHWNHYGFWIEGHWRLP